MPASRSTDASSSATVPAPSPLSLAQAQASAAVLAALPEAACVESWSAACRRWWDDDRDLRLRERALETLLLSRDELAAWLDRALDEQALIDAHRHAVSMRAGVERDVSRRRLATRGLRDHAVFAQHRGGGLTVFAAAEEVPARVAELCATAAQLPDQPLVRAAWMAQAVGAVHPFQDGNGGTSRFLASLELVRARLPPFVLTAAQRNRSWIDALMTANRTFELEAPVRVIHAAVQRTLATTLLADAGEPSRWDAASEVRATTWIASTAARWRARLGPALDATVVDDELARHRAARLARRGYRIPSSPAPRGGSWRVAGPIPLQLDLAIVPVRGGETRWLFAIVDGSIGDRGQLAPIGTGELVSALFVAPDLEPAAIADHRFERWLDVRLEQIARGLASWT